MYDFNGDYETIYTGTTDISQSGLIDTYNGSPDLPQWKGKHCSNVQGASDGTKFKGGLAKNESILFFRKSLCRAAPMKQVIINNDCSLFLAVLENQTIIAFCFFCK
ncbi:unnamed protein product [Diatraea saccharalis]|uniref:Uncharacterized protein n=1 Tax=Diatraea saccharalis TaxID=40085 RepID=A0A9N9RBW4_9NEOP|nr:unnamed protein product [Diatraea saccharalis]